MKKITFLGSLLSLTLAIFAQKPAASTATVVANSQPQNDTLSFAYLVTTDGKPIFDSSDCFTIGDLQAAKLLVFPVSSSSADMMDELLDFSENPKTRQTFAYFKCIVQRGVSGGTQYQTIQKTLENKLRTKLKQPNLRIRLIWAPQLFSGDAEVNFITAK